VQDFPRVGDHYLDAAKLFTGRHPDVDDIRRHHSQILGYGSHRAHHLASVFHEAFHLLRHPLRHEVDREEHASLDNHCKSGQRHDNC
jgi:hypothetical protein